MAGSKLPVMVRLNAHERILLFCIVFFLLSETVLLLYCIFQDKKGYMETGLPYPVFMS
jgi:hypothetical protein